MASGTTGAWLNEEEIKQVRESAGKWSWIEPAPDLMKKADTFFRAKKMKEATELYSRLATIQVRDDQVELAKRRSAH